jgi:hypothetical protein
MRVDELSTPDGVWPGNPAWLKIRSSTHRSDGQIMTDEMPSVLDPFRFVLIAVAGWMNQRQLQMIEYLREENR